MKVERIVIIFSPTSSNQYEEELATTAEFENGHWKFNGPVKSSICELVHLVWKVIRANIQKEN